MNASIRDEVYHEEVTTAKIINDHTGTPIGTVERNETSDPRRILVDGVEYDIVKESWYGPELTISVRPLQD